MRSHPFIWPILIIATAAFTGCRGREATKEAAVGTVVVEYLADGQKQSVVINEVAEGTTLEEVMRSIDEFPVEIQGSGVTAFVDGINGIHTNQREGWTYRVDGQFAGEGIGSLELHPPTTITWRFGSWNENGEPMTQPQAD